MFYDDHIYCDECNHHANDCWCGDRDWHNQCKCPQED